MLCAICGGPLLEPVETPCHHAFCASCVLPWLWAHSKCPVCVKPVHATAVRRQVILERMVGDLPVECSDGCPWKGTFSNLGYHRQACPLRPRPARAQRRVRRRRRGAEQHVGCFLDSGQFWVGCLLASILMGLTIYFVTLFRAAGRLP